MLTNNPVAPTVASIGLHLQTTSSRNQPPPRTQSQETLPSYYPESTNGCTVSVAEEKAAAARESCAKMTAANKGGGSGGKMATLKFILSGKVQRHHPMYAMERALEWNASKSNASKSSSSQLRA